MTSPHPPAPAQEQAPATRSRSGGGTGRVDAMFGWITGHPQIVDLVVFGTLTAACLLLTVLQNFAQAVNGWGLVTWPLYSVALFACGIFLRSRTGPATVAVAAIALGHVLLSSPVVIGDVMTLYALYIATLQGSRRTRRFALGAGVLGALLLAALAAYSAATVGVPFDLLTFVGTTIILSIGGLSVVLAIWALARFQRVQRTAAASLLRERERELEVREQRAALAVADERARIAREMHDVVAHALSVIIAQADGGRYVASQDPERTAEVLSEISDQGRRALGDMRSLLGVLRSGESTQFGPQPGIGDLPTLLDSVRAAGLEVQLEERGDLRLPQALQITVFRLVQESLTNVLKHAGPGARAGILLAGDPASIDVLVEDDGTGPAAASGPPGHGLHGMRQRVTLFSGTLEAGPRDPTGFRVHARIPRPSQEG